MTESFYIEQLKQLSESDWYVIFSGQGLLMINDCHLEIGPPQLPNVILAARFFPANDPDTLKQQAMDKASELYINYYTHPPTLYGFNDQLYRLIQQFSPEAFCAPTGQRAKKPCM